MNRETVPPKKKRSRLFLHAKLKAREDDDLTITTKQKARRLRRVLRRGDKRREHRSEEIDQQKATQTDLQITREVIESATRLHYSEPMTTDPHGTGMLNCFRCGCSIPQDCIRCPECGVLYVQDPRGEAIDEGAEYGERRGFEIGSKQLFEMGEIAFAHFDADSGIITSLKKEDENPDFGLECHNCGAITQFETDLCPLCGRSFDDWDTGLIGLLEGLKFDLDEDLELNCPACGEHVVIQDSRCPSCKEILQCLGPRCQGASVLFVLNEKEVVFVHFGVDNGELVFAQKLKLKKYGNSESVHLDSISNVCFDQNWKSLSRI